MSRSVSGLLPGGRICALTLRLLPEKVSFAPAETPRQCVAVSEYVRGLPALLVNVMDCGATRLRGARNTQIEVHCRASLYFGVRIGETVERAEIAGMGSD